eukprot:639475-Rhodomonas_salina.2
MRRVRCTTGSRTHTNSWLRHFRTRNTSAGDLLSLASLAGVAGAPLVAAPAGGSGAPPSHQLIIAAFAVAALCVLLAADASWRATQAHGSMQVPCAGDCEARGTDPGVGGCGPRFGGLTACNSSSCMCCSRFRWRLARTRSMIIEVQTARPDAR